MLRTWRGWHLLQTGVLWYVQIIVIEVSVCENSYVCNYINLLVCVFNYLIQCCNSGWQPMAERQKPAICDKK